MLLADWLKQQDWTNQRLAQQIGVTKESVRLYRAGLRRPASAIAARIAKITDNKVTEEDLQQAYVNAGPHFYRIYKNASSQV